VLVLQRFLDRGQRRTGLLPLPRVRAISVRLLIGVALLVLNLPSQALQVEVAQRIRAQAPALEVFLAGDVGVLLQQVRDPAEDGSAYAIGSQTLEQQERLEGGVGRAAGIHPPVPMGVFCARRAMERRGLGKGSQRDC
jgi:hypothetical protein